jgi:hypothetical protein
MTYPTVEEFSTYNYNGEREVHLYPVNLLHSAYFRHYLPRLALAVRFRVKTSVEYKWFVLHYSRLLY